jgi:hypothetical protein
MTSRQLEQTWKWNCSGTFGLHNDYGSGKTGKPFYPTPGNMNNYI